ncbi:hypothetical protein ACVWXO_009462 [Bradyrhizobium sp. LM2.7]
MRGLEDIERFRVTVEAHVATVTITAPPVNAQDRRFREECIRVFDVLGADADVRAIVLTGDGKAFSAGADLSERAAILAEPGGYSRHSRTTVRQRCRTKSSARSTTHSILCCRSPTRWLGSPRLASSRGLRAQPSGCAAQGGIGKVGRCHPADQAAGGIGSSIGC